MRFISTLQSVFEWKQLASMEPACAQHCSVVLEDLIYAIGGFDGENCLNSVESYNPLTYEWKRSASLTNARKCAAATSVGGKIFVVGGFANQSETSFELTCEMFDPCVNQWSLVSSLNVPRAECGIVCVDETVYVFGGEGDRNYVLNSMECYNAKCNGWKQVNTSMPSSRTRVQASLLTDYQKGFLPNEDHLRFKDSVLTRWYFGNHVNCNIHVL